MQSDQLAQQFEENRAQLQATAFRMLGSLSEAEDAVQEAWLRLSRTDEEIDNLPGWLTRVTARICLDMLRTRKSRREQAMVSGDTPAKTISPEEEAILADSIGLAMMVVLQTLAPPERVAFILHDVFDMPFDDIASIVDRTPTATRQLASRARRRIQGKPSLPETDMKVQRQVVDAFTLASRTGDMAGLLTVLAPDVTFRPDAVAAKLGGPTEAKGAEAVAKLFSGRAQAARPALIDGQVGIIVAPRGRLFLALITTVRDGQIVDIEVVGEKDRLDKMELALLAS